MEQLIFMRQIHGLW
jgi:hypothetical protein